MSFDPGYVNTAALASNITHIDGDNGTLLYRGYPIQSLAEEKSFLDLSYLIISGELPSQSELMEFYVTIRRRNLLRVDLKTIRFFPGVSFDASDFCLSIGSLNFLPRPSEHQNQKRKGFILAIQRWVGEVGLRPHSELRVIRRKKSIKVLKSQKTLGGLSSKPPTTRCLGRHQPSLASCT